MDGPAVSCELDLPGFRFHPTEEELLEFYLKGVLNGKKLSSDVIGMVNIYHHDPWDLPGLAKIGEREWYFFVQRDRRHSHGGRPNRTTHRGFWKATGSDRPIRSVKDPKRVIGLRKTLVFYSGRAPRGCKTDWVMNEYRMPDASPLPQEDTVLCKIYRKATSLRTLGQRAAAVEQARALKSCITSSIDQASSPEEVKMHSLVSLEDVASTGEKESEKNREFVAQQQQPQPKQQGVSGVKEILPELQLPKSGLEWMTDPFLLRSPWLDMWSPYANVLNF